MFTLYVLPEHWGQGLGRAVIKEARLLQQARGSRLMSLWVLHNNTRAIRFYEKLGFAHDTREKLEQWQGVRPFSAVI